MQNAITSTTVVSRNDVESTHSTSVIRTIDVEGYSILLQVWKHAMQKERHSTSVIGTIDVEWYSILLRVWQHAMQKGRQSTSVIATTDVEWLRKIDILHRFVVNNRCKMSYFLHRFLLIIDVECSLFYIGQITDVEGHKTFNIVYYDDAS